MKLRDLTNDQRRLADKFFNGIPSAYPSSPSSKLSPTSAPPHHLLLRNSQSSNEHHFQNQRLNNKGSCAEINQTNKFSKVINRNYLYQYLATLSGSLSVLSCGINLGWTSPYLPQILNGTYPDIVMTPTEGSWCAVMPLIATPIGALIGALLVDKMGRKLTTLLMAPYTFLMFIFLAFVNNVMIICLIRFVIGIVEGVLYTTLPMYLGEISSPAIRGILNASVGFGALLGTLLINILGFYYPIFTSSLICSLIPLIHLFTFMWMPESPYYLIKRNRNEEAREVLKTLRGTQDVDEEMVLLCQAVARQELVKKAKFTELFTVKSNLQAVFIFSILCMTRKFSGNNPFLFYTAKIFQTAEGSLDPRLSVIIFLSIQIVTAMIALYLLDRLGRRPIIMISTAVCIVTLAITGTYFFFKEQIPSYVANLGWLPITVLTLYIIFYNIGLELSPIVYVGELFPTNVKAIALGFAETFSAINSIITAKLFHFLTDSHGMYLPFWIFSACCAVGLVFIVKFVPETKNKTLEEIQSDLMKKSKKLDL
ncbi:hypothetical protein RN001_009182 [Aquatica leii]|uniref:Major facilitator superfamily (MFS) profile domain-containing protein n=1 Tax=Aquatica leii TaxID=1421715 RepID=A0AAN7S819_9COLE|nr:hypothetical protein RN001_009182 [Aquatica leii]